MPSLFDDVSVGAASSVSGGGGDDGKPTVSWFAYARDSAWICSASTFVLVAVVLAAVRPPMVRRRDRSVNIISIVVWSAIAATAVLALHYKLC